MMGRTRRARQERRGSRVWGLVLRGRSGGSAFGLILIFIGVVLGLEQQGLIAKGFWLYSWPWFVIIPSLIQLATARTASRVGSGVLFALLGGWFRVVESHWRNLTWANSWPLSLVAVGASIMAEAVAGQFLPEEIPGRGVTDEGSRVEGHHDA